MFIIVIAGSIALLIISIIGLIIFCISPWPEGERRWDSMSYEEKIQEFKKDPSYDNLVYHFGSDNADCILKREYDAYRRRDMTRGITGYEDEKKRW
jgi:hypothetical protein